MLITLKFPLDSFLLSLLPRYLSNDTHFEIFGGCLIGRSTSARSYQLEFIYINTVKNGIAQNKSNVICVSKKTNSAISISLSHPWLFKWSTKIPLISRGLFNNHHFFWIYNWIYGTWTVCINGTLICRFIRECVCAIFFIEWYLFVNNNNKAMKRMKKMV